MPHVLFWPRCACVPQNMQPVVLSLLPRLTSWNSIFIMISARSTNSMDKINIFQLCLDFPSCSQNFYSLIKFGEKFISNCVRSFTSWTNFVKRSYFSNCAKISAWRTNFVKKIIFLRIVKISTRWTNFAKR